MAGESEIGERGSLKIVNETVTRDEPLRLRLKEYSETHPHHTTAILSWQEHIGVSRLALDFDAGH